jgi:dienelactone hydrolase
MRLVTQTALITFALLVSLTGTAYADGERTHAATGLVYDLLGEPKPGESVHFVVCLHGAGDNKDNFRSYADGAVSVMRERMRIYVNSPSREGWPGDAMGKVIDLTKDLQKEFKCRSTVLFGFSAGGYLSTRCMAQAPEVFDGMVINGATISGGVATGDKFEIYNRRFGYWSLGDKDANVAASGGIDGLKKILEQSKWETKHWQVDVVAGLEHKLDGKSATRGVEWVTEQIVANEKMTPNEKEMIDTVDAMIKAENIAGVQSVIDGILENRRRDAMRVLFDKLDALPTHKNPELQLLGIKAMAAIGDPRGGRVLAKALSKVKKDETLTLATIEALGACSDAASVKALEALLTKWDFDGKAQIAAATALGALRDAGAVPSLLKALKSNERKDDRAEYVTALNAALVTITGGSADNYSDWAKWLNEQAKKK